MGRLLLCLSPAMHIIGQIQMYFKPHSGIFFIFWHYYQNIPFHFKQSVISCFSFLHAVTAQEIHKLKTIFDGQKRNGVTFVTPSIKVLPFWIFYYIFGEIFAFLFHLAGFLIAMVPHNRYLSAPPGNFYGVAGHHHDFFFSVI